MKKVLVVLDGVGDRPCKELGGKTPLEAAEPKNLNALAKKGRAGSLRIAGDVAPESDVGVFSVLGYDAKKYHVGRGALEALGIGLRFNKGMLALRANFATTDAEGKKIIDRRVGRSLSSEEAKALAREINKKVRLTNAEFEFAATIGHRAVLVINAAKPLSKKISNTDPAYENVGGLGSAKTVFEMKPAECKASGKEAEESAGLVNEFAAKSHTVLEESKINAERTRKGLLPANFVLLRDAENELRKPPPRKGWAIISEMPMEDGIGKLVGMKILRSKNKEYDEIAKTTLAALKKFDGVYVHLKGPDLFGHDGDTEGKKNNIKKIDAEFFGALLPALNLTKTRVAVTADHSTPCALKAHSADPVPFLLAGAGIKTEGKPFKEGQPPLLEGPQLMKMLQGEPKMKGQKRKSRHARRTE